MRRRDVAGFLAELERRLDGDAGRRRHVAEIAEHLDDLVAEARARGEEQAAAEQWAVARFGSPRRLARGLGRRRRVPVVTRVALAVGALGLTASFAYAQLRAAAPVVAISFPAHAHKAGSSTAVSVLGESQLVALDPVTLRVVRRGPVLDTGHVHFLGSLPPDFTFVAPDGSRMAVVSDASLQYFELGNLKQLGTTRLGTRPQAGPARPSQKAGETDVIRTGAWLSEHIVALVQHQVPPYASRVSRREVVVIDPATRTVLSRHPSGLKGAVVDSVHTADHDAILGCSAGRISLLDIAADGSSAVIPLALPCGQGPRSTLVASGSTLVILQAGSPLLRVDLATRDVQRVRLHGALAWSDVPRVQLRAVWWRDRVIVTGGGSKSPPIAIGKTGASLRWYPAGVTSIDPRTGNATVVTRSGAWVLPTPSRLIVGGPRLGLTAFAPGGKRVWHVDGKRTTWPFGVGDTIFAPRQEKRHTIVDSFSALTGRQLASRYQKGEGTRPFTGVTQPTG